MDIYFKCINKYGVSMTKELAYKLFILKCRIWKQKAKCMY